MADARAPAPKAGRRVLGGARGWVPIAVPAVLTAILASWGLGRRSMYGTEEVTYWAAHLPASELLRVLVHVDVVHGLYYALMHVAFLFGDGTIALRVPSAIGMTVTVAMTGLLASKLSGSTRLGFFAGLSMVSIPLVDSYAQGGRSYSIDAAAVLVTSYLLLRAVRLQHDVAATTARPWLAYAAALAVSGYLHEMTLLIVVSHAITLGWSRVGAVALRRWRIAVAAALVALVPLVVAGALQQAQLNWIHRASIGTAAQLAASLLGPSHVVIAVNVALILVGCAAGLRQERGLPGVTLVRFALPLLVLPSLLLLIESAVAHPLYGGPRYVLYSVAGAAMLVGAGLDGVTRLVLARTSTAAGWLLGAAVVGALLAAQWPLQEHLHSRRGEPQDMLALSGYVAQHARPGDGIVYASQSLSVAPFAYPQDFTAVHEVGVEATPVQSGTLYGTLEEPAALRAAVLATPRIWLVGATPTARSSRPDLREIARQYRAVLHHRVPGARITLFARQPPA